MDVEAAQTALSELYGGESEVEAAALKGEALGLAAVPGDVLDVLVEAGLLV